jgi:Fur family transcriptional regulator, peroxide stress response regulator
MEREARLHELTTALAQRGARMTPQRMAILEALLEADHPTVEQIHRRVAHAFPMTSLVTVYRTLAMLVEMGVVLQVDAPEPVAHYDGFRPQPHPHLTCAVCGRVADAPNLDAAVLADLAQRAAGWRLSPEVCVMGVCPACQATAAQTPPTSNGD